MAPRSWSAAAALLLACASADGKTAPMDSEQAAKYLNDLFLGHGHGAFSGVFMRQLKAWELWCGGDCYQGRPDCTVSAAVFNTHLGMYQSKFTGGFAFGANYGVVFDGDRVARDMARCFYATDAMSWERYNGGCGCKAEQQHLKCGDPHSPFKNVAPNGQFVDGDNPLATQCHCSSTHFKPVGRQASDACFWSGPAYNTSHGRFGKSEFSEMIEQYDFFGINEKNFIQWNEVVIDGHLLQEALSTDPATAIVAIFYNDGGGGGKMAGTFGKPAENLQAAKKIQQSLQTQYGVTLPIVCANKSAVVTSTSGPFFAAKASALEASSPDSSAASVVV